METNPPPEPPPLNVSTRSQQPTWRKKIGGALTAAGVLVVKFFSAIKFFLLPLLKTGGSMLISIWVYSLLYGWWFGVGFVILIFVHECGHLLAAKRIGLHVGLPVFIPFMGAVIALKEAPRNAWIEAQVGIGGPLLGSLGAGVCGLIYLGTGNPLFLALANVGFMLNLFNLVPIGPLDGGRIVTAISPWLWIVGYALMAIYTVVSVMAGRFSLLLFIILIISTPRLISLFRPKSAEQQRFFEVAPAQRLIIATMYFGLILLLVWGMAATEYIPDNG